MLTATPVNNRLTDLQHMIELFSRRRPDHFKAAPLGIHSLAGHFRKLEKASGDDGCGQRGRRERAQRPNQSGRGRAGPLERQPLPGDCRSTQPRVHVKESQDQHGGSRAIFPTRKPPRVAEYQLRRTYGRLLDIVEQAFEKEKPLFSLAIYYPLAYYKGPDIEQQKRAFAENRQREVVGLIRTQFLKRFESSARRLRVLLQSADAEAPDLGHQTQQVGVRQEAVGALEASTRGVDRVRPEGPAGIVRQSQTKSKTKTLLMMKCSKPSKNSRRTNTKLMKSWQKPTLT